MANPVDPWVIQPRERARYEEQFRSLRPVNGIITGDQAKGFLLQSQLPPATLGQIWGLADTDSDGKMNINEFSIACKLINLKLRNFDLPKTLPPALLQSTGVQSPPQIMPQPPPSVPLVGLATAAVTAQHVSSQPPARPAMPPMIPPLPNPALIQHTQVIPPMVASVPPMVPVATVSPLMSAAVQPMAPPMVPPMTQPLVAHGMPPMIPAGIPSVPISAVGMQPGGVMPMAPQTMTTAPVQLPIRPPSAPPVDRVGSIESPMSAGSPLAEWAVPHQSKLKYTQLFNTLDRSRSGYLSGPQARNVMVQSQLPQPILAQIWALSDMDSDGRLSCDEFVLALHLCETAKAGQKIGPVLPPELIPPTFRRQRQGSLTTAQTAAAEQEGKDAALNLITNTFEDKRKENFEKGQAELERRRKNLLEIQRKEQEERERKEKDEQEKREKVRLEQERRRQAEFERQLQRQREAEQEREEQRKRQQEQREAARREMSRQRQLEWEKSRSAELQQQRQREQENVLKLKAKNQNLGIELSTLNEKVKELSSKISETRLGVSGVKTTIDGMRSTRDAQLQEMSQLKSKLKEQNQRLVALSQEKVRLEAKNKMNLAQDVANQEQVMVAFSNKQITLKQLRDRLDDLQKEIEAKLTDIENNNSQLGELRQQLGSLVKECEQLYTVYEDRRNKVLELKGRRDPTDFSTSWGDTANTWDTAESTWATEEQVVDTTVSQTTNGAGFSKYRALYEFVARNEDEISFQPGDIILVPQVQNAEPGWLAGEIRGHTGWFPESYVEPVDSPTSGGQVLTETGVAFPPDVVSAKSQLEEITEVPENLSDNGSMVEMAGVAGTQLVNEIVKQAQSAVSGETTQENYGYFIALYPYSSPEAGDLNFNQGEVMMVVKKDGDWWTGVIGDRQGIFPSNYVQPASIEPDEVFEEPELATAAAAEAVEVKEEKAVAPAEPKYEEVPEVVEKPVQKAPAASQQEAQPAMKSPPTPDFAAMSATTMPGDFGDDSDLKGKSRKPEIASVLAPYQATSAEQLSLARGQLIMIRKKTSSGWWEGELQAKGRKRQVGWFPASYVKLLTSGRNTPLSHSERLTPDQDKVVALFPYSALNADELSFNKDDVITLITKEEAAWWRGELNGVTGLFPSNYVAPISDVYLSDTERRRQDYIKELIMTEEAYIEDMLIVHDVFEKPLRNSKVLTKEEVAKIFINWRDIIVCNHTFLRALRVRREMSDGGLIRMIGDILCENLPRMTSYVRFCSCQLSAAAYLQRLTENSGDFRDVQRQCQQDPRTKGMPLSSFLIKPMQRITKYPLIIKKILEYTPESHPDFQNLQEALAKAEEFCTQVNEGVREKENSERLEWLQRHIHCDTLQERLTFNSLTNSLGPRKFLHHGILHKAKSGKELVGFLMNDFLLLAQPSKPLSTGQAFSFDQTPSAVFKVYKQPLLLNKISITNDSSSPEGGEAPESSLKIYDSVTKITLNLVAPSKTERNLWVKNLERACRELIEMERCQLQRAQSKQAQFGACGRVLVIVTEGVDLKLAAERLGRPKGLLMIRKMRAKKLVKSSKVVGKCDAFCEVTMGSQTYRTPVVAASTAPQWNASMQFLVKDVQEDVLCVTVFDHDFFSPNGFLGRTEVRISDIYMETHDKHEPIVKHLRLREVEAGEIRLKLDLRLFNR